MVAETGDARAQAQQGWSLEDGTLRITGELSVWGSSIDGSTPAFAPWFDGRKAISKVTIEPGARHGRDVTRQRLGARVGQVGQLQRQDWQGLSIPSLARCPTSC